MQWYKMRIFKLATTYWNSGGKHICGGSPNPTLQNAQNMLTKNIQWYFYLNNICYKMLQTVWVKFSNGYNMNSSIFTCSHWSRQHNVCSVCNNHQTRQSQNAMFTGKTTLHKKKQNTSYDTRSKAHEKTKVIHLDAYDWKSKQYVNKFNMPVYHVINCCFFFDSFCILFKKQIWYTYLRNCSANIFFVYSG